MHVKDSVQLLKDNSTLHFPAAENKQGNDIDF